VKSGVHCTVKDDFTASWVYQLPLTLQVNSKLSLTHHITNL